MVKTNSNYRFAGLLLKPSPIHTCINITKLQFHKQYLFFDCCDCKIIYTTTIFCTQIHINFNRPGSQFSRLLSTAGAVKNFVHQHAQGTKSIAHLEVINLASLPGRRELDNKVIKKPSNHLHVEKSIGALYFTRKESKE